MKMKKLLILCPYPHNTGASQRLKYEPYIPDWEANGWQVTTSNFMSRPLWTIAYSKGHFLRKAFWIALGFARRFRDFFRIRQYDAVYIHMWVAPFGGVWVEKIVRRLAKTVIYDFEDNILEPAPKGHPLVPSIFQRLMDRTEKVRYLAARADGVIVASPFLLEPLKKYRSSNTHCIPPSLDMIRICPDPEKKLTDTAPVIGWTGTLSSLPYLDLIAEPLRLLAQRVSFRLRVITNCDYEMPGVDLEVVRWSAAREVDDLRSLDIGVYPLIDDEWTRGKAGLKIIQYQAAGIPCVASQAPLSALQIEHGVSGFLAEDAGDWIIHLERLLKDSELRTIIGKAGRARAVQTYSREAVGAQYREVLAKI